MVSRSGRASALVALLLGGVLVAGCTAGQDSPTAASGGAVAVPSPEESWPSGLSRKQEAQLMVEQQDRYVSCMRGEGIRIERSDEPGRPWITFFDGLDDATVQQIRTACRERSGPEPEIVPATRQELSALYDLKLEAKKCLEARGVTVSEPPSRQQWIEDYTSDSWDLWSPLGSEAAFAHSNFCPDPDVWDVHGIDVDAG